MTDIPDEIMAKAREIDPNPERDISGETRFGLRVAAYRETHPEHGDKFGHSYSEHWSTPNWSHPQVKVERLYTEDQLIAALLSERTASEAALKEARDRIAELENERKIYRKALLRVHAKANVMTYCAKENASDWKFVRDTVGSVILAKTGGA